MNSQEHKLYRIHRLRKQLTWYSKSVTSYEFSTFMCIHPQKLCTVTPPPSYLTMMWYQLLEASCLPVNTWGSGTCISWLQAQTMNKEKCEYYASFTREWNHVCTRCTHFVPVHRTYSFALIDTISNKALYDKNKYLSIGCWKSLEIGGEGGACDYNYGTPPPPNKFWMV